MSTGLFDGSPGWADIGAAIGLALGVAYVVAHAAALFARRAFARALGGDEAGTLATASIRRPVRIVRSAVFLLTAAALILPALRVVGVGANVGARPEALAGWLFESGLRIVFIGVAAYVLLRVVAVVVQRFEFETSRGSGVDVLERAKRVHTLGSLIRNVASTLVIGAAALMMLRELRVDIMPVLTGAGILGLAVGFGAQTLVKDVIAGFFLILENQIRIGDMAVINGVGGSVEAINLRTIVLRDLEGAVHVFPNGAVATLSNRSRDFSYAVIDVTVPFRADLEEMLDAIRKAGADVAADAALTPYILEPLEVLGIEAFDEAQVHLKVRMKTIPLKQFDVGRALRWRLKKLFDERDLGLPHPHVSVQFGGKPR